MTEIAMGTMEGALAVAQRLGVPWSSLIDVGSADGHFALVCLEYQFIEAGGFVNVDPNPVYQDSLERITAKLGGAFRQWAISDHIGEMTLTVGAHPYWNSLRPAGDPYWTKLHDRAEQSFVVPCRTLDALVADTALRPPYLLKLDVQGGEVAALRGGTAMLQNTSLVIVEADVDDFAAIHGELDRNGFQLFDLTEVNRTTALSLGWFHPVYIHRRHREQLHDAFWTPEHTESVVNAQIQRRNQILTIIDSLTRD